MGDNKINDINLEKEKLTLSNADDKEETNFECNICLEQPKEPVVTLCGHLYCWSCLYYWLKLKSTCPVCKSIVDKSGIIPLYGRGCINQQDPREHIPPRPFGQRREFKLDFFHHLWNIYEGVLTVTIGSGLLFMQLCYEIISLIIHLPTIPVFIYQHYLTNMQQEETNQEITGNHLLVDASKVFLWTGIIFLTIIIVLN